jgi:ribonuclease-3
VLNNYKKNKELLLPPDRKFVKILKTILGFRPGRIDYYHKAFIHKSATKIYPTGQSINNERLEYLGDAILDAIIAEYLFDKFPFRDEGFLTQMRSKIVNRENLNFLALKLGINQLVISNTANSIHKFIYGDALEALIGALYIDKGYRRTKKVVINRIIKDHINVKKLISLETDFKSRIIEWGQKNKTLVNFESAGQPDENNKNHITFISHLFIGDELKGQGVGYTKKEAEQNASKQAIEHLIIKE